MKTTAAQKIIDKMRATRDENGVAYITSKQTAVLVRLHLKKNFPGVKFSVRSDHSSVHVGWNDGPPQRNVEAEIGCFSFGGFDGMIDMAYSSTNWLLPDGTMEAAACTGTEGSRGTVASYETDCPQPGAVLVKGGPTYVTGQKHITPERMRQLITEVAEEYGVEVDHDAPYHNQSIDTGRNGHEYLPTLAWQRDQELYKD